MAGMLSGLKDNGHKEATANTLNTIIPIIHRDDDPTNGGA